MERAIKFRGIRIDTGEWVYGCLIRLINDFYIMPPMFDEDGREMPTGQNFKVKPETIGQLTGGSDRDKKEIYEGDLIRYHLYEDRVIDFVVTWDKGSLCWMLGEIRGTRIHFLHGPPTWLLEKIGTMYENPEIITEVAHA